MKNIKRTTISLGTLGDSHVGKSALTEIYLGREFSEEYLSTIGINANIKDDKIIIKGEEKNIKITKIKLKLIFFFTTTNSTFISFIIKK